MTLSDKKIDGEYIYNDKSFYSSSFKVYLYISVKEEMVGRLNRRI